MKSLRLGILFILVTSLTINQSGAQPYGNEWIQYNQKYLKFKISEEGIYRLEFNALNQALSSVGENLATIDPRNFQIFANGEEQYIWIEGEADSSFDSNDFIEFYGVNRNAWLDSLIYTNPSEQQNPHLSLFNDTSSYFLTWNTSTNNRRLTEYTQLAVAPFENFFIQDVVDNYHDLYYWGVNKNAKYDVEYTAGEGWFGQDFDVGTTSKTIQTPNFYNGFGAPNAILSSNFSGVNNREHVLQLELNGAIVYDTTWPGYQTHYFQTTISPNDFSASTTLTFNSLPNVGNITQKKAVSFLHLSYPHSYDLENKGKFNMRIPQNGGVDLNIECTNFNTSASNPTPYVYDLSGHYRISTTQVGNVVSAQIPGNSLSESKCFITNSQNIVSINQISPVGNSGSFTDFVALNADSAFLMISHKSLWTESQQYASIRNTSTQDAVLADIEEICDQFSYGIQKHPLSIRNFCRITMDQWNQKPQYLFIIGKAIHDSQQKGRFDNTLYAENLIPSYGWPASDNAFSMGLGGALDYEAGIPTGRLAAANGSHVTNYLNKVVEYQNSFDDPNQQPNIEDQLWQKRLIHFGGGTDTIQQNRFRDFLQNYQDTVEGTKFGGRVFEFYKRSANAIDFNLADSITEIVNQGTIMLSFFGHSSSNSFDVSIDAAASYNNQGKYFWLLSNGCFAGDIHQPNNISTSEDFVLTAGKGAIGFIATTDQGYPTELNRYSRELYDNFSDVMYNQSMGKCMKEAAHQNLLDDPTGFITKATVLEMTLHGDPSLSMSKNLEPDYAIIDPPQVLFEPQTVTTDVDSFDLQVVVSNIGMARKEAFTMQVIRTLPNNTKVEYEQLVSNIYHQDTVTFRLPVNSITDVGINTFEIRADAFGNVMETSEFNNTIKGIELNIKSSDLIPIYPYNYATIPDPNVTLKASTSDPLAGFRDYIIQIDTVDTYDSPLKQEIITNASGGVIKWNPQLSLWSDSIVYFWRASPYFLNADSLKWREFSFQYIPNERGWNQDHFRQFKNNDHVKIDYNYDNRNWSYDTTSASISCSTIGFAPGASFQVFNNVVYRINQVTKGENVCNGNIAPVIFVVVVDPKTLDPWQTADIIGNDTLNYPEHDFGNSNNLLESNSANCRPNEIENMFSFLTTDQETMDSLASMINNRIPQGHYVLLYTGGNVNFQTNPFLTPVKTALSNIGSSVINFLQDSVPWIHFQKMGSLNPEEHFGLVTDTLISISANMENNSDFGTYTTDIIGPARNWDDLKWKVNPSGSSIDSVTIRVFDINNVELANFSGISGDVSLNGIDASLNPYIKLTVELEDGIDFSCGQTERIHLTYTPVPELALNARQSYFFHGDTLLQGDQVIINIALENVSEFNFDSLVVEYRLSDQNNNIISIPYQKTKPLIAGDIISDTLRYPSSSLYGPYLLSIEANPKDSDWEMEQFHFNNVMAKSLFIERDRSNPILDVTFDGVHILDGDIVSAEPEIMIQLNDENPFLVLNEDEDTSNFEIYLSDPDGVQKRVYFSNSLGVEILSYEKATSAADNKFKIFYNPVLEMDGVYKLSVQATDKAGNKSGDFAYEISFEIVRESSITSILNYPNPFSSSTRFVFTLTGSQIPDMFMIQIMTVTGKVVKEITQDDIGNLRIGRNITDYAWDGTDNFGDPLGNGIYLYRVVTRLADEEVKHRETSADSYFKKGFGKMYLMR